MLGLVGASRAEGRAKFRIPRTSTRELEPETATRGFERADDGAPSDVSGAAIVPSSAMNRAQPSGSAAWRSASSIARIAGCSASWKAAEARDEPCWPPSSLSKVEGRARVRTICEDDDRRLGAKRRPQEWDERAYANAAAGVVCRLYHLPPEHAVLRVAEVGFEENEVGPVVREQVEAKAKGQG